MNKYLVTLLGIAAFSMQGFSQSHHGFYYVPEIGDIDAFNTNNTSAPRTLNCWITPNLSMPVEIQGLEPTQPYVGNNVVMDIPDMPSSTIKGVVYCGNKGIGGVVVSDGNEVTITDADGRYYLNSNKINSNVFISIPNGYSVKNDGIWPKFYTRLQKGRKEIEQVNFELVENNCKDYVVIGLADIHIANVRQTIRQYEEGMLPELIKTIGEYRVQGKDVYVMGLGDQSHDLYWYDNNAIDLEGSKEYLKRIVCSAMFTTMGNHDNDPYVSDDFAAEDRYRATYGPTHYSFNIAGTHYIMLDNIVYTNEGGKQGTMGDREYEQRITTDQLDWLRKDLATVDTKTPVIIGMHARLWKVAILSGTSQEAPLRTSLVNFDEFVSCLKDYNVTVLTGHGHVNTSVRNENIVEYNIASAAGRLWESGQTTMAGNHMCGDGSVGGYLIMEMNGTDYKTHYKSMNYDHDYQFRTYDLNNSQITAAKFCPKSTDAVLKSKIDAKFLEGYDTKRSDNVVRINVFNYNEKWKVKVTENGKNLTVKRVNGYDPLWTISVPCYMVNSGKTPTSGKMPTQTSHLFDVQTSSPTSTLEIEVTDEWGKTYKETMIRPKALNINMK